MITKYKIQKYKTTICCRRLCEDYSKKKKKKKKQQQKKQNKKKKKQNGSGLNNIQQNVCNSHLMMTHGGVEIVVLKFSHIIRNDSDIITEYVNKKHLLTETSDHT